MIAHDVALTQTGVISQVVDVTKRANSVVAGLATTLVALGGVVTACGSGSGSTTTAGATTRMHDVITAFATSSDPGTVCDQMSTGWRAFISDGEFTRTACEANLRRGLDGPWNVDAVTFGPATVDRGQTLVEAYIDGTSYTFYLIPQYGTMKINSVDGRVPIGPSPSSSAEYDR